jgi:hypothetical protein
VTNTTPGSLTVSGIADALKSWLMVILTLGFVVLYGLALVGKLKPLADASIVSRIEPIVFLVIGYYFGRLPAQQNENTLRMEINRQTQKAETTQHAKEQLMGTCELLEEKMKNVKSVLASMSSLHPTSASTQAVGIEDALEQRVAVGIANRILTS